MNHRADLEVENARLRAALTAAEARIDELDALAHSDPLCPLPNRRGLMRALERAVARRERYDEPSALLFVDLDGLKDINDEHGHTAGDQALLEVSAALVEGTRKGDTVARIGGDEFCVLLERADFDRACESAARLIENVGDRFLDEGGERIGLSIAIGVATIEKGDLPGDVLERADRAMYKSKRAADAA